MKNEDKITEDLVFSLQEKNGYSTVEFGYKKGVFIGCTCGHYDNDLRLLFQSAEQDIVIYLKDDRKKYNFEGNSFFKKFPQSLVNNEILIPLIIFEVKYKKVNSHSIRVYSELAKSIKTVFPFCLYNLLLIDIDMKKNQDSDKIYMAGKSFDKIIYKSGYKKNNPCHKDIVETLWSIVQSHIEYLKKEKYFRLTRLLKVTGAQGSYPTEPG